LIDFHRRFFKIFAQAKSVFGRKQLWPAPIDSHSLSENPVIRLWCYPVGAFTVITEKVCPGT
jgi:hypothetical protein